MKFCRMLCILICIIALIGAPLEAAAAENASMETVSGCVGVDALRPIGGTDRQTDTAVAAVVYDRASETMIYGYNLDGRIYPASMVKLMTALIALEQGNVDDMVTVTRSALDSVAIGSVSAGLQRGEQISLNDLLYCMMVASANDAAAVIAEYVGGSQERFIAMMNERAAELGCYNTHYSNVHGLHDADTYSTARDILRLLDYCLEIPEFQQMFACASYTVPATNKSGERVLNTTNHMMSKHETRKHFDSRVTGGKTGATDAAGRCLAVTAKVADMDLVALVMGAEPTYSEDGLSLERYGSFEEMRALLDLTQKNFASRQLFYPNQVIAQYPVDAGSNYAVATPQENCVRVLPRNIDISQLRWQYDTSQSLSAPIAKGQIIGTMQVWYGDICLSATDLIAMNPVAVYTPYSEPAGAAQEKDEQAHGELLAIIVAVLAGCVLAVIIILFGVRLVRRWVMVIRVRRRRKNRRRNRNARMERS